MLRVSFNSALDNVKKSLRFARTLTKKGLKFFLNNNNISFVLYLTLELLPTKQASIFQKSGCKQNLVWLHDANGGKVIFVPLEEIIIFYVDLTPVDI